MHAHSSHKESVYLFMLFTVSTHVSFLVIWNNRILFFIDTRFHLRHPLHHQRTRELVSFNVHQSDDVLTQRFSRFLSDTLHTLHQCKSDVLLIYGAVF